MHHNLEGQAFTIFILTVAACEAGLALSLILALYQKSKSLDVELWTKLREPDLPPPMVDEDRDEPALAQPSRCDFPQLTPAGRVPNGRRARPEHRGRSNGRRRIVDRSRRSRSDT